MLYQHLHSEEPILAVRDALAPLAIQLDRPAVDEFCATVDAHFVDRSRIDRELEEPAPHVLEQHRLWRELVEVTARFMEQLDELTANFRQFSADYFSQLPGRARDDVLIARLDDEARWTHDKILDRRAVRAGYLDFEAYQERQLDRETKKVARVRIGLYALEELARDMLERLAPADAAVVSEDLLAFDETIFEIARRQEHPDLAWLALRSAAPLLSATLARPEGSVPGQWLTLCVKTVLSNRPSSWMRRSALEILALDPESGVEMLEGQLAQKSDARDSWHVSARAAELLGMHFPNRAIELFRRHLDSIEGDAIKMSMALATRRVADADAVAFLVELGELEHPLKARNAAAESLAALSLEGGEVGALAATELANFLMRENAPEVIATLAGHIRAVLAPIADEAAPVASRLRDALAERLEVEPDTAVASEISALRLDLADIVERSRQDEGELALYDFQNALFDLGHGESVIAPASIAHEQLARCMARASRQGYGLYASQSMRGWKVRRGERFRTRLWRILHEIRHPTPNKRQGFRHTRARFYPGRLRAHPEALGEVTPTTVPGERRQVASEGGWGPYVPLVDDLLDAQLSGKPTELATTAGITRVQPPDALFRRLWNYLRISWKYAALDEMRLAAVSGKDEQERSRFLEDVRAEFNTTVVFQPHYEDDPAPPSIRSLVSRAHESPLLEGRSDRPRLPAASNGIIAATAGLGETLRELGAWGSDLATRFGVELFERGGVRIRDLAIVIVALLITFLGRMLWVRITFDRWRNDIPLSVGGWGTRGKSGTERLKAGLFHGLGHEVFVKTTGCEAMFIHAPRRQDAREIFIYRPYDKASIWEQGDMLGLGRRLGADVFLWECMALNPRYVSILQTHWMRDDLVTLTNAYPDHEDIQGPAGVDVAETISNFIPENGLAITSEREMLPIFERVARERDTTLYVVDPSHELSIPDDVIDRFPYREHPRNIALVARMATELGIDRGFSLFAMADYVVPDLGVLKIYPEVNVLGRDLYFINGCSANERAGFMANWTRLELDEVGPKTHPDTWVMTVVNNRGDRISRSVVFADILVRDVAVDRHVLIGTNLSGLRNYFDDSLDRFLANVEVAEAGDKFEVANARLERFLSRVRIEDASAEWLVERLVTMAKGCGVELEFSNEDAKTVGAILADTVEQSGRWHDTVDFVAADERTRGLLGRITPGEGDGVMVSADADQASVEVAKLGMSQPEDIAPFFAEKAACIALARRFRSSLQKALEDEELDGFHEVLRGTWRERFWSTVISIDDPDISGDGIIVRCAHQVPPGFTGAVMGTQNIKGTGLDFVYRWVNLDSTARRLDALEVADETVFQNELLWLAGARSLKLTEALMAWRVLRDIHAMRKSSPREAALIARARTHLAELALSKYNEAAAARADDSASVRARFLAWVERVVDPFDALWRRYRSEYLMRLLAAKRISHTRMADEMQKLTKRQKGGWLTEKFG